MKKYFFSYLTFLFMLTFLPLRLSAKAVMLPDIGVSLNIPENGGKAMLISDILTLKKLGCKQMFISCSWAELETSPNKYYFNKLISDVNGAKRLGFRTFLTLKIIDTNNLTLPSDLNSQPFDTLLMQNRLNALLRALLTQLPGQFDVINLGNEVDCYLSSHPDKVKSYRILLAAGRNLIKSIAPKQLVGLTITYNGLVTHPDLCRQINSGMDIISMTYYPLRSDFSVAPISQIPVDIKKMVSFAAPRRLLLQEAGYPAANELGSSDAKQAQFIDSVMQSSRLYKNQIMALNLFLLYDFNKQQLDVFEKYYHLGDPRFRAYLATLGLKRSDGVPRLSWLHFYKQMQR